MTRSTSAGAGVPPDFLALLRCPYCGTQLETDVRDVHAGGVRHGIMRCACHEYPIVDGIPILQQIDGLHRVVKLIDDGDFVAALLRALDLFRVQWAHQSGIHRLRYYWNCSRLASASDTPFSDAAQLVRRPRVLADYLVHRYANPSFLAAIGPMLVLAGAATAPAASPVRVLDLGCGAGHASFVMNLLRPDLSIVSADQDFVNVYLARRYLVPGGLHLCLDAQVPSPFPDAHFDAVYCQDAFHYFKSKKAAVDELKRVTRPGALWVFPHLHNRLCDNVVPGVPLSPEGYLECFALPGARLFAESELLRGISAERLVDLGALVPAGQLHDAPNLTLVSGEHALWRAHRGFPEAFCRRLERLRVNPIYVARAERDGMLLERRWPNPVFARECAEAEAVLPASCRLTTAQLAELEASSDGAVPAWVEDLVAKFVLVALPERYTPASAVRVGISSRQPGAGSAPRLRPDGA